MSYNPVWVAETTIFCPPDISEAMAQAASLAAGMKSDQLEKATFIIAPSKHEKMIQGHLDWWGYALIPDKSAGDMTLWIVANKDALA